MNAYPAIAKLGTILGIWAHPDDESWCAAGILAAATANGQRVVCVTATRGEAGQTADESRWPQAKLANIRTQELDAALHVLGITEHAWLPYHDGQCDTVDTTEAINLLVPIIKEVQPDTILTFGPDGLTGHPDHKSVSRWTDLAVAQATLAKKPQILHKIDSKEWYDRLGKKLHEQFNIYFMTDKPPLIPEADVDVALQLPPELIERKLQAFAAQPSQMGGIITKFPPADLRDTLSFEGFMRAK